MSVIKALGVRRFNISNFEPHSGHILDIAYNSSFSSGFLVAKYVQAGLVHLRIVARNENISLPEIAFSDLIPLGIGLS